MKLLFSLDTGDDFFWIEEENAVYSLYSRKSNSHRFLDENGDPISYQRKKIDDCDTNFSIEYQDFGEEEDEDTLIYNQFGVACGDYCLFDKDGNEIPDTKLNFADDCDETSRYFIFGLLTEEQEESISQCGTASGITVNIYDTKTRKYVAKKIPECILHCSAFDGEPEVILAALDLINDFESLWIYGNGTIIGHKDTWVSVFDYYSN